MSNPGGIAALVTAIASLAGLVTFFVSRHDKAKDPLPKQTAEVALAAELLGLVEASAKRLNDDVTRLTARVDTLESQREGDRATIEAQQVEIRELKEREATSQTQVAGLERRVAAVITDRDGVIAYVLALRTWWASGGKPPAPAIPLHLRDVIPDWSPTDADRSLDVSIEDSDHHATD